MAIKINLLPQSYALEKRRNQWIAGMAGLLGLTGLGIGLLYLSDQKLLEKVKTDIATIQPIATRTTTVQGEAQAATNEATPVRNVVDFMADASKTGPERAAFLDLTRRYIYENALVSDIDVSNGRDFKMTATVRSPDEYYRFLLALRQGYEGYSGGGNARGAGRLFETRPNASGVPGFPEGRRIGPTLNFGNQPIPDVLAFKVDAAGTLRNDATNPRNSLLFVPQEPTGTAVSGVAGAAGGAPGGAPTTQASPSGSPGGG